MEKNIFLVDFKPGTSYEQAYSCLFNLNYMQKKIKKRPQNYDFGVKLLQPFINDIDFGSMGLKGFTNTLLKGGYTVLAKESWNGLNEKISKVEF